MLNNTTEALYKDHLQQIVNRFQKARETFQLDAIIIASGSIHHYFKDDNAYPFKPFAAAQQWLPFPLAANTFIVVDGQSRPTLYWPADADFWHATADVPDGDWQEGWHIVPITRDVQWLNQYSGNNAWIGPDSLTTEHAELEAWLNFERAKKTDFEIQAIHKANIAAALGHKAATEAFFANQAELDIYLAYLAASRQTSVQEPYAGIVALNQNAATLHYERKNPLVPTQHHTLLIDAGASCHGYASDITRTTTTDREDFAALLESMETLQLSLCQKAVHGADFVTLHQQTLHGVADILKQHDLCTLSVEEQLQKRIPHVFYPHGLGHLLGLQVHDVGGHQSDRSGALQKPPADSPFLRLTRTLETGMVVTIEPGLYFIPMLLQKMEQEIKGHGCNMDKIGQLAQFGGIRIEDNVLVGANSSRNLTREAFSQI